MAASSLEDRLDGHTTLTTTTTHTTHGIEEWLLGVNHESPFVEYTRIQAGHKPTLVTFIDIVLRPPDHTTTHSPQSRIAPSVDSSFLLSHR